MKAPSLEMMMSAARGNFTMGPIDEVRISQGLIENAEGMSPEADAL